MAALHCEVCSRWDVYRIGSDGPHRRRCTVLWWRSEVEHAQFKRTYLQNHKAKLHQIFCVCYLWRVVGSSLVALQYVMYFWFSG